MERGRHRPLSREPDLGARRWGFEGGGYSHSPALVYTRGMLAMTLNRCHSQLCAREVFSPRQPLPCGLAGRCAGVIEVARALCCLWSAAVTGCLFPSVTRSPLSVVLAALSAMRRADWSRSCPCPLPTWSVRSSSRSLVSVDACCSSRSIGTGAVAVVDRRGQGRGRFRLSWRSLFGPRKRAVRPQPAVTAPRLAGDGKRLSAVSASRLAVPAPLEQVRAQLARRSHAVSQPSCPRR